MTAPSLEQPFLYVEGKTDLHTIRQLMARHGITLDETTGPVIIKDSGSDKGVLLAMKIAGKASTQKSVGFVIDADVSIADRWIAVRDRLQGLGLNFPDAPPADGFIGESYTNARVGVWIMPNNTMDKGRLEDLVQTLVPDGDGLFDLATSATNDARKKGAQFPLQDLKKAELHCWLAWQETPGVPFGLALKAKFLNHDSEVAKKFVAWFRRLFGDCLVDETVSDTNLE